ncbi:MAG: phenylalanine--tRNA ligase subunit beta, partial [Gammaproteobacteria bacterium]|nr:phenylalanine--tRNA ligase subunit beta [Gammaproteobacteria bacterium]
LIEEVARIHGYDEIPQSDALVPQIPLPASEHSIRRDRAASLLADRGYQETINYSFVDASLQRAFDPDGELLTLANPISEDMTAMRRSLLPGLARVLGENVRRQQDRVRLFELGTRFLWNEGALEERFSLAGLAWGLAAPEQWGSDRRQVDFFDVKGDLEALLALAVVDGSVEFAPAGLACMHPGKCARVTIGGRPVGWIGEMHPKLSKSLELKIAPIMFEIDYESSFSSEVVVYKEISKFPAIRRDLAVVLDERVTLNQLRESVSVSAGGTLKELRIFDVYRGSGVEPGRKSVALGLILQETSRTLTDADADAVVAAVVARVTQDHKATIRD